jgi:hypothetical protein
MEEKDLNNEHGADGMAPSSKSRSRRKPGAHGYRKGRLNDAAVNNQKRKRPNAQKHGVFSVCPFIPDAEEQRKFDELHSALIDEWNPSGQTEENLVFSIADRMWRKLRSQKFVRAKLIANTLCAAHPTFEAARGLIAFAYYVRFEPETALEKYADSFLLPDRVAYLKQNFPRSNYQSPAEWAEAVLTEIESRLDLIARQSLADSEMESHSFAEAWRELIDQHNLIVSFTHARQFLHDDLTIQERLDADIARLIKQLIQLKAMKQLLRQTAAGREDQQPKRITASSGLQ